MNAQTIARDAEERPEFASLSQARAAVEDCTRCPLYQNATQAVFGEGPKSAPLMLVGEQPGDSEDLEGKPFVGPAGKMLDAAMAEAGIDRKRAFVTNAVKHFKFTPRGKKRLHQKPNAGEVQACKFWLDAEIGLVRPNVVVAMGATAAQSLVGRSATITKLRGAPVEREEGPILFVTVHPSYLLRMPDRKKAALERARFIEDLARIRDYMENEIGVSVALDSA